MGNDMLVIDPRHISFEMTADAVQKICDRHFGVGADGICYGPLTDTEPFLMHFYNPDGSRAGKSGNGLRIFARYLCDAGYVHDSRFSIAIDGVVSQVEVLDDSLQSFKIGMGQAIFASDKIPMTGDSRDVVAEALLHDNTEYTVTCVNVGNPHCVIFTDKLSVDEVKQVGAMLEVHPAFPERTNMQWVQVIDKHTIQIEIWERGAGYTLASGTSSCATTCASIVNNHCESPVNVRMAGGEATVHVDSEWNIQLTGTVQSIAQGMFAQDFLDSLL